MLVNSLPNENGVFVALPPSVRDHLRPSLKEVRLEAGSTLYDITSTSDHTWFITSRIISLITTPEAGGVIEAATIGQEGMVGFSGITKRNGIKLRAYVRISGEALQIDAKTFVPASVGKGSAKHRRFERLWPRRLGAAEPERAGIHARDLE